MTSRKEQAYLEMLEQFIVGLDDDEFDEETDDADLNDAVVGSAENGQLRIIAEETAKLLVECEGDGSEEQYCKAIRGMCQGLDGESKKKMVMIGLICSLASDECNGGRRASFYVGDMHKLFEAALVI